MFCFEYIVIVVFLFWVLRCRREVDQHSGLITGVVFIFFSSGCIVSCLLFVPPIPVFFFFSLFFDGVDLLID